METYIDGLLCFLIIGAVFTFAGFVYTAYMVFWYKLIRRSKKTIREILKEI